MNKSHTPGLPVVPCVLPMETKSRIESYAEALEKAAPGIGDHGLDKAQFEESGLFRSALERLRGKQAATMHTKQRFIEEVLAHLSAEGRITGAKFTGSGERHDYQVEVSPKHTAVFEAKGCLDGNNTTLFQRPPNADEFFIWSLCQNAGADPRKNVWSGIHTRLSATIIAEQKRVDALVVWDMCCGTIARPCPKLADPGRATVLASGRKAPPPCIYLFPKSLPDPRNNPDPPVWSVSQLPMIAALVASFGCLEEEVFSVHIKTRLEKHGIERITELRRNGAVCRQSKWTAVKRARSSG